MLQYQKNCLCIAEDKKLPGAAQRSEYYLKYGKNPNGITPGTIIM